MKGWTESDVKVISKVVFDNAVEAHNLNLQAGLSPKLWGEMIRAAVSPLIEKIIEVEKRVKEMEQEKGQQ